MGKHICCFYGFYKPTTSTWTLKFLSIHTVSGSHHTPLMLTDLMGDRDKEQKTNVCPVNGLTVQEANM